MVKRLTPEEERTVVRAIRAAEERTSAEIRVHIVSRGSGNAMHEAQRAFARLAMTATRDRNAVLLYVCLREHAFAVWGDRRAHEALGDPVWIEACRILGERLRAEGIATGIAAAVEYLGLRLGEEFPRAGDDRNELPDSITTDEGEAAP
jgi:uncharacterized membrane protein